MCDVGVTDCSVLKTQGFFIFGCQTTNGWLQCPVDVQFNVCYLVGHHIGSMILLLHAIQSFWCVQLMLHTPFA